MGALLLSRIKPVQHGMLSQAITTKKIQDELSAGEIIASVLGFRRSDSY
jgi:hypothetical protein